MYNEDNQNIPIRHISETPSFEGTLRIHILSAVLLLFVGMWVQHLHLLGGLVVTEILCIAAPPLLYTLLKGYHVRHTFHLEPISAHTVLLTVIIACSAFVLVGVIAVLQSMILPQQAEYQALWDTVLRQFHEIPFLLTFLLVSVLPGVCEEFLFRGFLLHGVRKRCSDPVSILLVGLLFGLFHLDPYRFLPVSLLGMLFSYVVVRTGSLFTGIVAHCTNNAIAISISYLALTFQNSDLSAIQPGDMPPVAFLPSVIFLSAMTGLALMVFLLSIRALPRAPLHTDSISSISDVPDE